jgi:hypothetical protein
MGGGCCEVKLHRVLQRPFLVICEYLLSKYVYDIKIQAVEVRMFERS